MRERLITAAFMGVALALLLAAVLVQPERRTPKILSDQGQAFYPKFTDPQAVKTIEVVDYDEPTATARPLKVELRKTRWVVASNNDYPIDVGDRLVKTAAALMDLRKDQVRSDAVQEHPKYGVVDPLDQTVSSLTGRGKRVTLRDAGKSVLADFILGKAVENKPGWRYVRVPGEKRTYAVKTDADPSARFADWVNAGLLRMPAASIRKITVYNYTFNPGMGRVDRMDTITLTLDGGQWKSAGGEPVNQAAVKSIVATLDGLKIVDARPKPAGMAQDLRDSKMTMSLGTALALQQRGFFISPNGRIFSSEGEMSVDLANGVVYQLRFGDLAAGTAEGGKATGGESRYLFVTASHDPARAAKYGDTSGTGDKTARDLNARFADWFYTISTGDFQKLRPQKKDLLR